MNSAKLKGKLKEAGITYKDLAENLDISLTSVCKKINNKVAFDVREAYKISQLLGVDDNVAYEIFLAN